MMTKDAIFMAQTSKRTINKAQTKQYTTKLFAVLTKLSPSQLMLLYGDLFTENESVMLAKRLEIARSLLSGKSYLQIQKQLGVTANTVSQIQKLLKTSGAGFRFAAKLLASLKESKLVSIREDRPAINQPTPVSSLRVRKTFFGAAMARLFTLQSNSD